ncbi:hypothetical protein GUITHDRAFT_112175 [Guillardia theta CCMP2712]|uniref:Uncharacterized protein n=2 Tax=Guillardia theta TaxID=55529 RepID=L1J0V2_GUITC|nr:hypothetical protein GUITHDRAFT_112175 [Guillardia theta CCMP2712]EKX41759.1 hypothetical protein GUITHDRAFT_112175 [Guillardia theta CCMP2712]|eukprot:XP_005828739.1 hypothetical protein GUITHDRAFT_112175 [Guillardia theta CCMP2712]
MEPTPLSPLPSHHPLDDHQAIRYALRSDMQRLETERTLLIWGIMLATATVIAVLLGYIYAGLHERRRKDVRPKRLASYRLSEEETMGWARLEGEKRSPSPAGEEQMPRTQRRVSPRGGGGVPGIVRTSSGSRYYASLVSRKVMMRS